VRETTRVKSKKKVKPQEQRQTKSATYK